MFLHNRKNLPKNFNKLNKAFIKKTICTVCLSKPDRFYIESIAGILSLVQPKFVCCYKL